MKFGNAVHMAVWCATCLDFAKFPQGSAPQIKFPCYYYRNTIYIESNDDWRILIKYKTVVMYLKALSKDWLQKKRRM